MVNAKPHVSIGMPVYNGEAYLAIAIESLLAQDFEDFELIISDNASTDATKDICCGYAKRDRRIRYYRNTTNLGAAANYNRLFTLSSAPYFKWAPHDDVCAPAYLRRCVEVLDSAPAHVVLCYPKTVLIDEHGSDIRAHEDNLDIRLQDPSERLRYLLWNSALCHPAVGLIRSRALRATRLIGNYPGADNTLLAELVLQGEFWEIPEPLFFRRVHERSSLYANRDSRRVAVWFDPGNQECLLLPSARRLVEHVRAIQRSSLGWHDKVKCYEVLWRARFVRRWHRQALQREMTRALKKGTWDRASIAAIRRTKNHYLPHRVWAFLSGLRHLDRGRLILAMSLSSSRTRAELLGFVARCLSQRCDTDAEQLLTEWLNGPCDDRRAAAAKAVSRRQVA